MGLLDRVKIGEQYALRVPGNGISSTGVNEIIRILNRNSVYSLNADAPEAKDWEWAYRVGGKGEYVGVIAKRVAKWCHQKHKIKLSPETVSQIGNVGNQHCDKSMTYYFDFDAKFAWKKGDFGDEGSCYFAGPRGEEAQKPDAVACLKENKALAMRFFTDESFKTGIGRVWIIDHDKWCLCINGYWRDPGGSTSLNHGTDHTLKLSRILAQWLDHQYYHQCDVECSTSAMWINGHAGAGGSKGIGFAVGPQDVVASMTRASLRWTDPKNTECITCGQQFNRRDTVASPDGDGDRVCKDCLSKHWDKCDHCGSYGDKDSCETIDGHSYCKACWDSVARTCSFCAKVRHREQTYAIGGKTACRDCIDKECKVCSSCGSHALNKEIADLDGENVCTRCMTNKTIVCSGCNHRQKLPVWIMYRMEDGKKRYYDGNYFTATRNNAYSYITKRVVSPGCVMEVKRESEGNCKQCGKPLFEVQKELDLKPTPVAANTTGYWVTTGSISAYINNNPF